MNTLPIKLTFLSALLCALTSTAQKQTRYIDAIFSVSETSAIKFSTQVPQPLPSAPILDLGSNMNVPEHQTTLVDLYMDVYQPMDDQVTDRPLIIFCFGGGFTGGSRGAGDIKTLATSFAKKGYVTAAIDYRLGINVLDQDASDRALYRAVQDSRTAIRYFRHSITNGNPYNIAANKIYLVGNSSGGFVALHNAYLDENERTTGTFAIDYQYTADGTGIETYSLPDLGCLDCAGDHQNFSGKADVVIAFAGALGSLDFIEGAEDIPGLLFHSTNDMTVPYNAAVPYGAGQTQLKVVYGSGAILQEAQQKNAPIALISHDTRGHSVHSPDGTQIYPDVLAQMTAFLSTFATVDSETLGFSEVLSKNEDFLVKNPIAKTAAIWIQKPRGVQIQKIQVFNSSGQLVFEKKLKSNSKDQKTAIPLKGTLASGFHLLKITATNGMEVSKKVLLID